MPYKPLHTKYKCKILVGTLLFIRENFKYLVRYYTEEIIKIISLMTSHTKIYCYLDYQIKTSIS
jgi:hypothetical protein